jgi:hypothetical protein
MLVYLVRNTVNGMDYVGQTTKTPETRWRGHVAAARTGRSDMRLLPAIREYGPDSFTIEVLQECDDQPSLNRAERAWIERLETLAPTGYNGSLGIWRSKDQAARTGAKLRGRLVTWADKIAATRTGQPVTEQQLANLAAGRASRTYTRRGATRAQRQQRPPTLDRRGRNHDPAALRLRRHQSSGAR